MRKAKRKFLYRHNEAEQTKPTFDSSNRPCFLPNMLFLIWKASDLLLRPSMGAVSPATLLAVVLGFVSES